MMNIFRLAGDISHVISILILLLRLRVTKNAVGISLKTQELYLLVFVTRYLDLFTTFYSLYNTVMKVAYISTTAYIVYMIRETEPFKSFYDRTQDSFLHWKVAVLPCAVLAIIINVIIGFDFVELFWTFSIILESIAILPQLIVLHRYREVENLTGNYVFFLGLYRLLYIVNWVYRSYYEPFYRHNWIAYTAGVIQTIGYIDFFYFYIISKYSGQKLSLPK